MVDMEWDMDTALRVRKEEGIEQGRIEGRADERMHSIRMLMKNTGATTQKAMEMLGIDKVLQGKYMALL